MSRSATGLRQLLAQDDLVVAPGAYDAITARVVEAAGYSALYVPGGGVAASQGHPDVNYLTLGEVTAQVGRIAEAVNIPIIVDADTGFGGAVNVARTVRDMESAGVAAIHLEDQPFPKRCGAVDGGELVPAAEMCQRIKVAVDERRDESFTIIARTDVGYADSFDESIERLNAYRDAGADVLFMCGMTEREQAGRAVLEVPGVHLYNYSGADTAPRLSEREIADLGYRLCLYTLHSARLAIATLAAFLARLRSTGDMTPLLDELVSWPDWLSFNGMPEFLRWEARYADDKPPAPR
jgi:2-methylisocitrate lyase-like PEP mutase family enzyme